jgi:hypothetical protein
MNLSPTQSLKFADIAQNFSKTLEREGILFVVVSKATKSSICLLAMNQDRALRKVFDPDTGGTHSNEPPASPEFWTDEPQAELYAKVVPSLPKKHSVSFINQRRKLKFLAEERLTHLSTQLLKLAEEIRYYDPLMAEMLDEAWDATEAAIDLMQNRE